MPRAYSMDLRERVLGALQQAEGTRAEVALRFGVSLSFVRDVRARFLQSGTLAPKAHGGGRPASADAATKEKLRTLVEQRADDTLEEHRESLAAAGGVRLSRSALGRVLVALGFTRKKRRSAMTRAKPSAFEPCAPPSKKR